MTSGLIAFVLASAVIGVRLLRLALRTRELPELLFGLGFLIGGVFGNVAISAWRIGGDRLGDAAAFVGGGGQLLLMVGALCLCASTWRVFHRDAAWATALFFSLAGVGGIGWAGHGLTQGFAASTWEGTFFWMGFAGRSLPYLWAAVSSGVYASRMRRRVALGLAEPIVANRFLLWAIGAGCAFAIFASTVVVLALGIAPFGPGITLFRSALGLVLATTMWLAFFPPRFWIARFAASGTSR